MESFYGFIKTVAMKGIVIAEFSIQQIKSYLYK